MRSDILAWTFMERIPDKQLRSVTGFCEKRHQLQQEFLHAVHEINVLQTQQTEAVISGDPDFCRFDILIHMAQEKKDAAKYAWIAHVESHHCEDDAGHYKI